MKLFTGLDCRKYLFLVFLISIVSSARAQWTEEDQVVAADAGIGDRFGHSVAIDGNYLIAGAYLEDESSTDGGAAYIYENDGTGNWAEVAKLVASDAEDSDQFGYSVGLFGDYAIVGSYLDDDGGDAAGSVYIFKNDGSNNWIEIEKLTASDAGANNQFGKSVSIDGEYIAVGADRANSNAGAVYVFKNDGSDNYSELGKLSASDGTGGDFLGWSVSISGDYVVGGAYADANSAGSAYLFKNNGADVYSEVTKLNPSDASSGDFFGYAVSIDGDYALIGAFGNDDVANSSGSAYIFKNDGFDNWSQLLKLVASDASLNSRFGHSSFYI